ncbi:MAG TPA: basic amino acid ABC transporter substrate-binding protein [Clostridia bacterium]|nr:basic amino acid ABC transporter substrate-binding protein [Clostridia bacterium]
MRKVFKLGITILLVFALAVSAFGCGQKPAENQQGAADNNEPKVIKVATDATYPPMEYVNEETGELEGFDIDLGNALAEEMGVKFEFINTAWEGIIPSLLTGQVDMIMSSMTITEKRKKQVNFSDPYFNAGQIIAVKEGNDSIKSKEDLVGKTVGSQIGTTGALLVSQMEGVTGKEYNTIGDAFRDLKSGRIDAVVNDLLVSKECIEEIGGGVVLVGEPLSDEFYGIAVRKDDTELLDQLNQAIKAVKENGKYDEIYNKWVNK